MSDIRHGRCDHCRVVWRWKHWNGAPLVSKNQAFCGQCGSELRRTAVSLITTIPVRDDILPIKAGPATVLRAQCRKR